jgi:hypothetical protein
MKPLWDYFDNEPFMENPHLGILSLGNSPKRKRKKGLKMAVRRRKRRMTAKQLRYFGKGRKRAPARKRRRRNWAVAGSVVPMNPPRRRRRTYSSKRRYRMGGRLGRRHHNPVRRRRRNPGFLSGFGMPPVKSVIFAGIGFAGPSIVSGFLTSTFPTVMQQTTSLGVAGKYIVKIGSILGLSWLTRRFVGSSEAHMVMVGGGANIVLSLVNDFAPNNGLIPANPLGMYLPNVFPTMQAQAGARGGVGAYVGLKGGPVPQGRILNTAAAFGPLTSTAMRSPAYGGVAARFKRF